MISQDEKLMVFENFRVDQSLPKYRVRSSKTTSFTIVDSEDSEDSMDFEPTSSHISNGRVLEWLYGKRPGRPWYAKIAAALSLKKARAPEITVDEFFRRVKNSSQHVEIIASRTRDCEAAILDADRAGQVALKEQLVALLTASRAEAQMVAAGLGRYLDEEAVVALVKKSSRAVRLDWVANFIRPIPVGVLAKKLEADELGIFDNYAVMHYDPRGKSHAKTAAQARDSILFGLVRGRRRLYYVGDWVDEQCNLTLEQVVDLLGKDAVKTA